MVSTHRQLTNPIPVLAIYTPSIFIPVIYIPLTYLPWTDVPQREKVLSMKQMPEVVIKNLGKRIRELRAKTGLSQEAFADEVGMDRTYISGIERGVLNPSVRNLARIAYELDVSTAVLFGCSGRCFKTENTGTRKVAENTKEPKWQQ